MLGARSLSAHKEERLLLCHQGQQEGSGCLHLMNHLVTQKTANFAYVQSAGTSYRKALQSLSKASWQALSLRGGEGGGEK